MPDTTDNAKLAEETVNIFDPAEAKRALDDLRAALASANEMNKRLVAAAEPFTFRISERIGDEHLEDDFEIVARVPMREVRVLRALLQSIPDKDTNNE